MAAAPPTAPEVPSSAQDAPAPQELGHKVFAGNLAYATTDEGLREFFAPVAGDILSVQVIQRGTRSAGYGFVSLSSVAAVEKAVAELDRKELDGRTIIVEGAKPAEAKDKDRSEKKAKKRSANRRNGKPVTGEVTDAEANGEATDIKPTTEDATPATEGEATTDAKPKKAKKARKPRKKTPANGDGAGLTESAPTAAVVEEGEIPAATTPAAPKKAKKPRTPRAPRAEGEEPTGEPSKSVVFVANLAFDVDDAALSELFTSAGIEVVSARVVRRRFGQPRRSKGYGFVDVGNEANQKKALEVFQGKEVSGREIAVKIAVSNPPAETDASATESKPEAARAASPDAVVVAN